MTLKHDILVQENKEIERTNLVARTKIPVLKSKITAKKTAPNAKKPPPPKIINKLLNLYNQNKLAEAEVLARDLTQRFPNHSFAWKTLGVVLLKSCRLEEAMVVNRKSITLSPNDAEAHNNLADTLKNLSRFDEAESNYRHAIAIKPDYAAAYINLGITLKALSRFDEAESSYRHAIAIKPDFAEAYNNLGNILKDLSRFDEAEDSYRYAIAIKPDYAEAYNNLGAILNALSRFDEAENNYRHAIAIKPDYAAAYNNLGISLQNLSRFDEAENNYRHAIAIKPDYAEAYSNLGNTLQTLSRFDEAESSCRQAIAIKPDYAAAYSNLGNTLQALSRFDEAESSYRQAIAIKPDYAAVYYNLGATLKDLSRFDEAESSYRQAIAIKPDYAAAYSNLAFMMNYSDAYSSDCQLEAAKRYGEVVAKQVKQGFTAWQCKLQPKRLRIGLVSGDFYNHVVSYFLENLLTQIDNTSIELFAYSTNQKTDETTHRLKPYFAQWKSIVALSDETAAHGIHEDGIAVLIDLSGYTGHNRLPIFAWKPAPIQVTWLGYFATTGVAEIDYILVDEISVPEKSHCFFTEKVRYLPNTRLCFSAPTVNITVTPLPALNNGYLTFGCFQNSTKVTDSTLMLWGEICTLLPTAHFRFQSSQLSDKKTLALFSARLADYGIEAARVNLQGYSSREDYLAAHSQVDFILDTFPFTGGTTTCEALWMGVPTLTLVGETLIARQGASILSAAGLPNWIVYDQESYIEKAVFYATDLTALATLRAGLREQVLASPLYDAPLFARNFEYALWEMWREYSSQQIVL
jgi:predicted O-linked N-acetylglucosamine transferase (SPINDLY family)